MKLVEINWHPTQRQLRQFGLLCLVALPGVGWLWLGGNRFALGCLGIAGSLAAIVALVYPYALRPVFLGLMLIAAPIGIVVGEIAMLLTYFTVFLPIGIVFRLMNRDRLQRSLDLQCRSYWGKKKPARSVANYYRQS